MSTTQQINVNPDKVGKDRYRMPQVQCQSRFVELYSLFLCLTIFVRKNNKTYILNLEDIAKAINRTSQELLKYFGIALNSQTNMKFVCLNGVHTDQRLQELIHNYIRKYVLCSKCQNPETKIRYSNTSKKIKIGCIACGHVNSLEPNDKFEKWIQNNSSTKK